jgi:hypothetical protein
MQRLPPAAGPNGHYPGQRPGSGPVGATVSGAAAAVAALRQLTDSSDDGGNGGAWRPAGSGSVTRIRAAPPPNGHPAAASGAVAVNGNALQHGDGGSPSTCSMQPAPPPPTPQSTAMQLPADLVLSA